jgi:uncharacterized protein (DUF305 family)
MRSRLIATMTVLALALAGCGSSNAAAPAPAANGGSDHNEADVQFSLGMIPHHRQTVQIADMATKKGSSEQVKVVAAEILGAEQAEITTMTGWLHSWSVPVPEDHSAMAGMDMDMPGMLSTADIKSLDALSGAAFDKKFLPMVAKHLQNGVDMAKKVQQSGTHAATKTLANKIVTEQEEQIKKVQALIV